MNVKETHKQNIFIEANKLYLNRNAIGTLFTLFRGSRVFANYQKILVYVLYPVGFSLDDSKISFPKTKPKLISH